MIKFLNKKFLPGVLALIFLLTMAVSEAALSQESQAGEQNVLRRASLEWMQVGMQQYQSKQFTDAEQSFRRALVFQKYLTDAERNQLNKYLANARIAISKSKQAVASKQKADESVKHTQPVKAAAKVEKAPVDRPAAEQGRQQIKKVPKTISNQPSPQQVQPVVAAKPSAPKMELAAETQSDIVVVKNKSSGGKLQGFSAWLTENRGNILMIGLPVLAVLIFISKLQNRRKRPGRRVFENPALAITSFIGSRLNGGNGNGNSKNGRPASAAANSKQKSFTQSTEHWKKNAIQSPPVGKPFETNQIWPGRKDKFEDTGVVSATEVEKKQCGKCKELKPLSDFYKNKSTKDGLARWCKECKRQYSKKRTAGKK
jgi:hypothetical protein